jgi:hypothetical protein
MKKCEECKFFYWPKYNKYYGECRINPPSGIFFQWPEVKPYDCCGQHVDKESKKGSKK